MVRANDAEPDAGRFLLGWARQAGFSHVIPSASVWCFATPDDRSWWGSIWAERVRSSAFADQAVERGLAERATLEDMAVAFEVWAPHPDAWFAVLHGEILATP